MNHLPFISAVPSRGVHPTRARLSVRHLAQRAVLILTAALPACTEELAEFRRDPVIGHIPDEGFADPTYRPQIPHTATVWVPLEITFWTWGGGCMDRAYTEVVVAGRSAEVTPYDLLTSGPIVCTLEIDLYEHKASVMFAESGTAEIELRYSTRRGFSPEDFEGDGRMVYTVEVSGRSSLDGREQGS